MKFCKFRDPRAGEDIFINPASARMIKKSEFSAGAYIVFEDGTAVTVAGTVDDVVQALEDAGGE